MPPFGFTRSHTSLRRRVLRLATMLALPCAAMPACAAGARQGVVAAEPDAPRREFWTFVAFWDTASTRTLARQGAALDVAITTWIALDSITGAPTVLHAAPQSTARGDSLVRRSMALVTSWNGARFHPAAVRRLGADSARLDSAARSIANRAATLGQRGLVLDFEEHTAADLPMLRRVIGAIARAARARDVGPVTVAVPATDTSAYPAAALIAAGADAVLPMLYDEHWAGGEPGPVASPEWVRRWLAVRVGEVGAARVVAGLPFYGYRWPNGGAGETVTYAQAEAAARSAGGRLTRDSASATLRAASGGTSIWATDAVLVDTLLRVVDAAGVGRVAFWYIGQEDPRVWPLLARRRQADR